MMSRLILAALLSFVVVSCGNFNSSSSWTAITKTAIDGKTPTVFYRQFIYEKLSRPSGELYTTPVNSIDYLGLEETGLFASFTFALINNGDYVLSYSELRKKNDDSIAGQSFIPVRTIIKKGHWSVAGTEILVGDLASGSGLGVWRNKMRSPGIVLKFNEDVYSKGLKGRSVLLTKHESTSLQDPAEWKESN